MSVKNQIIDYFKNKNQVTNACLNIVNMKFT